ncbi:MAG: hypothetical protein O2809_04310 [Proteobacteria bacterium]|nr:hypothetical protein [Pseudomonadota bacterium]
MHACPNTPPHDGVFFKDSSTVYANGKAIARIVVIPFLAAQKRKNAVKLFLRGKLCGE